MSSRRSALGSAPATSASPPVFANGAHSEATKRTFNGAGTDLWIGFLARLNQRPSTSVYPVVQVRENIVPRLDVGQPGLAQLGGPQIVVDLVELEDVLVDALGGVGDGGPGLHDERPVARLRQHQLAGRLVERAL